MFPQEHKVLLGDSFSLCTVDVKISGDFRVNEEGGPKIEFLTKVL